MSRERVDQFYNQKFKLIALYVQQARGGKTVSIRRLPGSENFEDLNKELMKSLLESLCLGSDPIFIRKGQNDYEIHPTLIDRFVKTADGHFTVALKLYNHFYDQLSLVVSEPLVDHTNLPSETTSLSDKDANVLTEQEAKLHLMLLVLLLFNQQRQKTLDAKFAAIKLNPFFPAMPVTALKVRNILNGYCKAPNPIVNRAKANYQLASGQKASDIENNPEAFLKKAHALINTVLKQPLERRPDDMERNVFTLLMKLEIEEQERELQKESRQAQSSYRVFNDQLALPLENGGSRKRKADSQEDIDSKKRKAGVGVRSACQKLLKELSPQIMVDTSSAQPYFQPPLFGVFSTRLHLSSMARLSNACTAGMKGDFQVMMGGLKQACAQLDSPHELSANAVAMLGELVEKISKEKAELGVSDTDIDALVESMRQLQMVNGM